jgi:hypothetical protein
VSDATSAAGSLGRSFSRRAASPNFLRITYFS